MCEKEFRRHFFNPLLLLQSHSPSTTWFVCVPLSAHLYAPRPSHKHTGHIMLGTAVRRLVRPRAAMASSSTSSSSSCFFVRHAALQRQRRGLAQWSVETEHHHVYKDPAEIVDEGLINRLLESTKEQVRLCRWPPMHSVAIPTKPTSPNPIPFPPPKHKGQGPSPHQSHLGRCPRPGAAAHRHARTPYSGPTRE